MLFYVNQLKRQVQHSISRLSKGLQCVSILLSCLFLWNQITFLVFFFRAIEIALTETLCWWDEGASQTVGKFCRCDSLTMKWSYLGCGLSIWCRHENVTQSLRWAFVCERRVLVTIEACEIRSGLNKCETTVCLSIKYHSKWSLTFDNAPEDFFHQQHRQKSFSD